MNVLLVEDDERLARAVERLAKLIGHHLVPVGDTAAARALLDAGGVSVAIADLTLGGRESGFEFLRWVREKHPHVLRVLASGALAPDEFEVDPPHQVFLPKPFGRAELEQLLGPA